MQAESDQEMFLTDDAELVVVVFGSIGCIVKSAVRKLRVRGHRVGLVRPITFEGKGYLNTRGYQR